MMESQEKSVQWLRQIAGTLADSALEEKRRLRSDDLTRDFAMVCLANGLILYRWAPDIGDKLLAEFGDDLTAMEQAMEEVVEPMRKAMGL